MVPINFSFTILFKFGLIEHVTSIVKVSESNVILILEHLKISLSNSAQSQLPSSYSDPITIKSRPWNQKERKSNCFMHYLLQSMIITND